MQPRAVPDSASRELTANHSMRLVAGGEFWMGSDDHYPEERPARKVMVDPFLIDEGPVTNQSFSQFVEETGHVTLAEHAPDQTLYPDADPALLYAGSSVFQPTHTAVALDDPFQWWSFVRGADWRHPLGAGSSIEGMNDHPVVHVSYGDAEAYARWAGKRLPSEAEWECAARDGLDRSAYAWGEQLAPNGQMLANYWQGAFPHVNLLSDGYLRTSPVGAFPPNALGLYDMIGNVWEWTQDWYSQADPSAQKQCCTPHNPRGGNEAASRDPLGPGNQFGRKVLKGGSHLCAENYCQRYRPAARYPQTIDTSTSHIGFRCALTSSASTNQSF